MVFYHTGLVSTMIFMVTIEGYSAKTSKNLEHSNLFGLYAQFTMLSFTVRYALYGFLFICVSFCALDVTLSRPIGSLIMFLFL